MKVTIHSVSEHRIMSGERAFTNNPVGALRAFALPGSKMGA
ncbi:hypothetical protein CEV34_4777 [Brucella pseudogrignonensis]|uniref:Uncharacterized protein n=1 Tax=Brucella pseudogrignonensis TaxID=419475 RepID=A0A256G4T7_9HYPH|nr:hypothetical protein CEV34_4777 [Brucella pseudogrignonensis]